MGWGEWIGGAIGNAVGAVGGGLAGGLVGGVAGAGIGGVVGGSAGLVTTGPGGIVTGGAGAAAGGLVGAGAGIVGGAYYGGKAGTAVGGGAGRWIDDQIAAMTGASEESEKGEDAVAPTTCTGDCGGRDPCAGLRKQLNDHKKKLDDYIKSPTDHDNKKFLGKGRDEVVIAARIASLQHQINNFAAQLKKCEEDNAGS
jgi:hypothetical protein